MMRVQMQRAEIGLIVAKAPRAAAAAWQRGRRIASRRLACDKY